MENKEIKLEDFEKARRIIVDYYNQDFTKVNGYDRPCICCDNKIKCLDSEFIRFPQSGSYSKGIVDKISAGYGSAFDTEQFIITICDTCIERLKNENKIQYAGNYMNMF